MSSVCFSGVDARRTLIGPLNCPYNRLYMYHVGPLMVAQWLRYCATSRKVAGSIPDRVIGIFY
jgi:hypothetical protein